MVPALRPPVAAEPSYRRRLTNPFRDAIAWSRCRATGTGFFVMTLIATPYCTEADVQRFFSSAGVISFADHDQSGASDTGVVDDCINQASEEISLRCQKYAAEDLADSTLVNRWATVLAMFFLCQRRGCEPPVGLAAEFERVMALLDRVLGGLPIPGVPLRSNSLPSFSNLTVDRRYGRRTIRVTENSNAVPDANQPQDREVTPYPYG